MEPVANRALVHPALCRNTCIQESLKCWQCFCNGTKFALGPVEQCLIRLTRCFKSFDQPTSLSSLQVLQSKKPKPTKALSFAQLITRPIASTMRTRYFGSADGTLFDCSLCTTALAREYFITAWQFVCFVTPCTETDLFMVVSAPF